MNKYILLIRMQNFFTNNFNVKICAICHKKNIYIPCYICMLICRCIPFMIIRSLLYLFNMHLIYITNNIYNTTNTNDIHITPIIMKFKILDDNNTEHDLSSYIKYYSPSIPLKFILKQNKINKYNTLTLNYLFNSQIINKQIVLNNIDILIYQLFISDKE